MHKLCHRHGWLFLFFLLSVFVAALTATAQAAPAKTNVHDVVYRADGTPASGTALISWPAFTTSDGAAVAAGALSLTLGPGGLFDAALAPNLGSTPAGTYYTIVFHLDDGKTSTEYWNVPATTTVTIGAIRTKVMPQTMAAQSATRDFVFQAIKPLAQDTTVVHRSGDEDVSGAKSFAASPTVPTPQADTHAANKRYVDDAVRNLNFSSVGLIAAAPIADQVIAQPSGTALRVNRISATTMNGTRYADEFASIQAAINDAATTGAVVIPASYAGTDAYSNPNGIAIDDLRGKPDRQKGFINAVTDCGVPTNGASDSCSAMTACIATHPGKRIALPKLAASNSGGGSATNQDYYSSCRWDLNGNGMIIAGLTSGTRWTGAVKVKFASGIGGVRIPATCMGCGVENIELSGSDLWNSTDLTTWEDWSSDASLAGDGPDGLQLLGGEPWVQNVKVEGFKRHGVYVAGDGYSGQSPAQPDIAHTSGVYANGNRGCGLYVRGADSNVGLHQGVDGIGNALCDITDRSYFGNTFPVAHSSMNARDAIIAGSNKTVASLSVSGNVLTITTSAAHGWPAGTWITTAGAADNSFNGTCKLLTSSGSTATCNFTHADGSTTGGTAATSSSAQVYAYYTAKTVPTGSYISRSASVFINPYQEANGRGPDFGDSSIVLGGAQMASLNQNWVTTGLWLYQQPGGITTLRTKYMKFVPHNSAFVMAVMDTGMTQNLWLVDATGKMTTTAMKVNTGVDSTGTGLSHKRVSTGSIAASSSAAVTVTWGAAFANTNYTVNCSVQEATASASTLRVHHIESLTTTTAVVRVVNDDTGAAHTGTLHCMAMHD